MLKKTWAVFKLLAFAFVMATYLSMAGCTTTAPPSLIDELQTQAQIPSHLTDAAILRYGEKVLAAWGFCSREADAFNIGGHIALAALSTGALATAGAANVPPNATKGIVAAFNFILQVLGIIKPAERNDARHEGAAMLLRARGAFLKALAADCIDHLSDTKFTLPGAVYFDQIGAAQEVVDKLLVGLAPRSEDLKKLEIAGTTPTPRGQCNK